MQTTILRRWSAYGRWQYAFDNVDDHLYSQIRANGRWDALGEVSIWGETYRDDSVLLGIIGEMDAAATDLCNAVLIKGNWPSGADEIVLTAETWNRTDEDVDVGSDLEVFFQNGSSITYRVSGIINNYAVNSILGQRQLLPDLVVQSGSGTGAASHLLLGYSSDMEMSEGNLGDSNQTVIRNDYAYPVSTLDNHENLLTIARRGLVALSLFVLIFFVWNQFHYRAQCLRQFLFLGADLPEVQAGLFGEAVLLSVGASLFGTVGAVPCFGGLLRLLHQCLQVEYEFAFQWKHFIQALMLGSGISLGAYLWSIGGLSWILTENKKHIHRNRRTIIRRRSVKRVTQFSLGMIDFRTDFLFYIGIGLVCLFLLLLPSIALRRISGSVNEYLALRNRYGSSYTSEMNGSLIAGAFTGFSEAELAGIDDIYGVGSVEKITTLSAGDYVFAVNTHESLGDEHYEIYKNKISNRIQRAQDMIAMTCELSASETGPEDKPEYQFLVSVDEGINEGRIPMAVWAVDPGDEVYDRIVRNLDAGYRDDDSFVKGESAVLMIPGYQYAGGDLGYVAAWSQQEGSSEYVLSDYRGVNDEWEISDGKEHKTIRIGGIVSSTDSDDLMFPYPWEAYTIICSKSFLRSFKGEEAIRYQSIRIESDRNADFYTDREVAKRLVKSNFEYNNNRERLQKAEEDMLVELGQWTLPILLLLAGMILILNEIFRFFCQYRQDRRAVKESLGCSSSSAFFACWFPVFVVAVCCILFHTLALSIFYTAAANETVKELGYRIPFAFRVGYRGEWYMVVCLMMILILEGICLLQYKMASERKGGE